MPDTDWRLVNASVVLIANTHNPSIINPDFLKNNGIVDADLEVAGPSLTTLAAAQINYKQNVSWIVTPDQCVIVENVPSGSSNPSGLYKSAEKYADVLKHIPYVAIGLNWQIILTVHENPVDWMKSKFLRDGRWQHEVQSTGLNIQMKSEDSSTFSLTVNAPNRQIENAVTVDCNFHFDIKNKPHKAKAIISVLRKQENYQQIFYDYLKRYFVSEKAR